MILKFLLNINKSKPSKTIVVHRYTNFVMKIDIVLNLIDVLKRCNSKETKDSLSISGSIRRSLGTGLSRHEHYSTGHYILWAFATTPSRSQARAHFRWPAWISLPVLLAGQLPVYIESLVCIPYWELFNSRP